MQVQKLAHGMIWKSNMDTLRCIAIGCVVEDRREIGIPGLWERLETKFFNVNDILVQQIIFEAARASTIGKSA